MAQYPQGVTTFIPDYQAYQPDFNFTANVLQLKQTQYDQNWNRLNNIYLGFYTINLFYTINI